MEILSWKPFVSGGIASIAAELGTFPIDLTKTRLQIQGQVSDAAHSQLKYRGMIHAIVTITKEEGVKALYSGIAPAVLRQATYGTIKLGCYHAFKRILAGNAEDETLLTNVISAVAAGGLAAAIANPTDVLKVRMQVGTPSTVSSRGMFSSFADIYKMEGFRGLYRGVGPNTQRAAVVVGVELSMYDWIKQKLLRAKLVEDTMNTHFLCGMFAGFAGAVASNPIDVIKSRLMNQRLLKAGVSTVYKGSVDCARQTIKTEGFMALYKGFIPLYFRLGPWNIIFFVVFEQCRLAFS
ncbi:kidney mitochondrial carrier protein 1-like isoform X2 [Corticium candelabrum]|uniref:kidney mitochondrial carrier protein 1-like isoform X2 n=1 Tax=Corticium candelabrum TaxID=121492 RepID=UPI002E26FC81|nr:kidney mitochondrial carrier protein 1-like isoform X2 [Corticium candelabrum]